MSSDTIQFVVARHAHLFLQQNQLTEAIALYGWLVERDPSDVQSRIGLAFAEVERGRADRAALCLPFMEHLPIPALQYVIGRIYASSGDPRTRAAFVRYRELLQGEPQSSQAADAAVDHGVSA
ncbi:tetratricopeptide repeat protein [Variovorax saccharolyticus]|uniref:tetratricopeptide repeat protein n=1 Tax=Variovorax saccharolyticus TaxID=3053516 RepID=UPI0025781CE2|nr:tetratricopeptide repeat protein [Variovorax sp. J31P216]MDM0030174.1 tetratricopeptide repeat protein [Variovorax sp. J31P216]